MAQGSLPLLLFGNDAMDPPGKTKVNQSLQHRASVTFLQAACQQNIAGKAFDALGNGLQTRLSWNHNHDPIQNYQFSTRTAARKKVRIIHVGTSTNLTNQSGAQRDGQLQSSAAEISGGPTCWGSATDNHMFLAVAIQGLDESDKLLNRVSPNDW